MPSLKNIKAETVTTNITGYIILLKAENIAIKLIACDILANDKARLVICKLATAILISFSTSLLKGRILVSLITLLYF
jgi:hypothetical protein